MSLIVQTIRWQITDSVSSKTHMTVGGVKTLCGRRIPRPGYLIAPSVDYCQHCVNVKRRADGIKVPTTEGFSWKAPDDPDELPDYPESS